MDKKTYIIFLISFILLIIFLYPKNSGYTYGGLISPNMTLQREEYKCFGYKYSKMGNNPFVDQTCLDCGKIIYCIGIPYQKDCYNWIVSDDYKLEEQVMECIE